MIAFFLEKYTVKDHISNTKLELLHHHYYIQTQQKDLFSPLQSWLVLNFKKKCPEKRLKIPTKCAHALGHPIILLTSN